MCPCLGIFQQLQKLLKQKRKDFVNFYFLGFEFPSFPEPDSMGKNFPNVAWLKPESASTHIWEKLHISLIFGTSWC